MTYQEAIEGAKVVAGYTGECQIVFQCKKRWYQKYRYAYQSQDTYQRFCRTIPLVKLLTITPNGTIAQ